MFVVVDLLAVEAVLLLQPAEGLTELQKLRPPALTVHPLLSDVLTGKQDLLTMLVVRGRGLSRGSGGGVSAGAQVDFLTLAIICRIWFSV